MPVNYTATVKNSRMDATRADAANGTLELLDGASVVVSFDLGASGGSVTGDVWTVLASGTSSTASAGGTVDGARIRASGGADLATGLTVSATGGGGDIVIDNLVVANGQTITSNADVTVTHA